MSSATMMQQRSLSSATHRRNVFVARQPFSARGSRGLSVAVYAKGKGSRRNVAGMPQQMSSQIGMRKPPTPAVDPDNAEFVVFLRAKNFQEGKILVSQSNWVPLSVVKGGQAANFLVKAMETEWGRKLYAKTLIKNIATAVYKDREQIERGVRQSYPPFKTVPSVNFEYGMKIRDRANPDDWYKSDDITPFPPAKEIEGTAIDSLKEFFSSENLGKLFSNDSPAAR